MFEMKVECPYCGNEIELVAEFNGEDLDKPEVAFDDPEQDGCGRYFVMFVQEIHFKMLCSRIEGE